MDQAAILKSVADNSLLLEALRELFTKQFAIPLTVNPSTDDALLGQQMRVYIAGIAAVESALREISKYKTLPKSETEGINQAR